MPGNVVWHKTKTKTMYGNIANQWPAGNKTLEECKQECLDDVYCKSLTYRRTDDKCILRTITAGEDHGHANIAFDYYEAFGK